VGRRRTVRNAHDRKGEEVKRADAIKAVTTKSAAIAVLRRIAAGESVDAWLQSMAIRHIVYDPRPHDPMFLEVPLPRITIGELFDQITLGIVTWETFLDPDDDSPSDESKMPVHPAVAGERLRWRRREAQKEFLIDIGKMLRAVVERARTEINDLGPLASEEDGKRLRFFERALEQIRSHYRRATAQR
jgi:hypothetical protein